MERTSGRNMKDEFLEAHPEGVVVRLPRESTDYISAVNPAAEARLAGSVAGEGPVRDLHFGALDVEIRLKPEEYDKLEYISGDGRCFVRGGTHLMDNYFVEGVALRQAKELIRELQPGTDEEFRRRLAEERQGKGPEAVTDRQLEELLRNRFPDGMVVYLRPESVGHLMRLEEGEEVSLGGRIGCDDVTAMLPYGTLQASVKVPARAMDKVHPGSGYLTPEWEGRMTLNQSANTDFVRRGGDFTGAGVELDSVPEILGAMVVEGIPFDAAVRLVRDEGITDDAEFRRMAAALRDSLAEKGGREGDRREQEAERISDVTFMHPEKGTVTIRCRIDGEMQAERKVGMQDYRDFLASGMTDTAFAAGHYRAELERSAGEKQGRAARR